MHSDDGRWKEQVPKALPQFQTQPQDSQPPPHVITRHFLEGCLLFGAKHIHVDILPLAHGVTLSGFPTCGLPGFSCLGWVGYLCTPLPVQIPTLLSTLPVPIHP